MRRVTKCLLILVLVTGACSDDDDVVTTVTTAGSSTDATVDPPATSAPTTTDAAETTTPPTTEAATTTAAPTTTATTQPPVPVTIHSGFPPALSRSFIPMEAIDAGWTAVLYSADTTGFDDGPTALYLVSPEGDRYELAAWEAGGAEAFAVGNISNDGTHVVIQGADPGSFEYWVESIDVATGTRRRVMSPGGSPAQIGTTLPTGRDVVVAHTSFNPPVDYLEVYRTDGSRFAEIDSLPNAAPGFSWLYGRDGLFLVVGDGAGLKVYGNDGTYQRSLDAPYGVCAPVRWHSASSLLARCVPDTVWAANGFYNELWAVPIDGSPPTRITAPPAPGWDVVEFGHADAWDVAGVTVLQWWGDCAARGIQVLQPDGTGAWLDVEPSGAHWIHARAGGDLVIHSIEGCGDPYGPVSLIRPDGSLVRTLVPQVAGYQGVISIAGMIPLP